MTYLRNAWYMAAWADEVCDSAPLARRYLDEPVVLFRDGGGEVRAVIDRCPHRFVPLSRGTVNNGTITCGYHGLAFDGTGACVANPHGAIVRSLRIRHYPVLEAYRAVWIWMGDPALADPAQLRDLDFLRSTPDTAFSKGYLHGSGNYELFVDNLLDLTHTDYLHASTLGSGALTRTRAKVTDVPVGLSVLWSSKDEVPSAIQRSTRGLGDDDRIDSDVEAVWSAPATLTIRMTTAVTGSGNALGGLNVHILTPETAVSSHYFFAATREYAVGDQELNERIANARSTIFATEDKPMIAAQQAAMGDRRFWDLNPVLLRTDEGAVRVRRKLAALIEREQAIPA